MYKMVKENDIASVYKLYVDDLYTYACYLGFNKDIVLDAIHDVFFKLACDEKKMSEISNIKFYLFRSLKNRLLDILKARSPLSLSEIDLSSEMSFNIKVNVEEILIETEEKQRIKNQIEEMLNTLNKRQREIVYLRYIQEYDYQQISELMGMSVENCHKLVYRSIQNLREKFGPLVLILLFSTLLKN